MTKTQKNRLEYTALRCAEAIMNALPRKLALALGALTGIILYRLRVHRKIVLKNFEHVGLWNQDQVNKILPKLYVNTGRYAADFLRSGKLPPYRFHDDRLYRQSCERGKGTIAILAHFGNWELLAAIFGATEDLSVIAMPMRNPLVENWLHQKRTTLNVKTIYTENALRGMLGALKRNGSTAILIDQNLGSMGTPAPFLGKTASTVRTVAGLARKTGATALPIYAIMDKKGSYDIRFFVADPPELGSDATEEDIISAIQAQHNDILSEWVKKYPEHWFGWFHRRFKGYVKY